MAPNSQAILCGSQISQMAGNLFVVRCDRRRVGLSDHSAAGSRMTWSFSARTVSCAAGVAANPAGEERRRLRG
eukprot:5371799-Prymnesium_polylepis.3